MSTTPEKKIGRSKDAFAKAIMRLDPAGEHEVSLRTAAYILALQRIGEAVEALGTSRYLNGDK